MTYGDFHPCQRTLSQNGSDWGLPPRMTLGSPSLLPPQAYVVIGVSAKAAAKTDYQVSAADFEAWEKHHGRIPAGDLILLRIDFSRL